MIRRSLKFILAAVGRIGEFTVDGMNDNGIDEGYKNRAVNSVYRNDYATFINPRHEEVRKYASD